MNYKEELIDYLKHYRHDWLNHVQIIKGYITLDKVDQAQKYLDQIIVTAHYESKISQLGNVELSYFLLTYNWNQDKVVLDVEIEEDQIEITTIGKNYPYLLSWIQELTGIVEKHSEQYQENRLSILFEYTQSGLILTIEFIGSWDEVKGKASLLAFKELVERDHGKLTLGNHNSTEFSLEIQAQTLR